MYRDKRLTMHAAGSETLERITMRLVNMASHLISSHPSLTIVTARKEF